MNHLRRLMFLFRIFLYFLHRFDFQPSYPFLKFLELLGVESQGLPVLNNFHF